MAANLNIYFETSAVNYLNQRLNADDAIATKGLQSSQGNKWYISTVTLWEILLTADEKKKDYLLFFCQHLFYEHLLKSPSEIAIDYIVQRCPRVSTYTDFHDHSEMGRLWKRMNGDLSGKIEVDHAELTAWTKRAKDVAKKLNKIINGIYFSVTLEQEEAKIQALINHVYAAVADSYKAKGAEKLQKIALVFVLYYLCVGIDLPQDYIDYFWKDRKIDALIDRLFYLVNLSPCILQAGPFIEFAKMAGYQMNLKHPGRGIFHDSLHCIYLPFVDVMMTDDKHFADYKKFNFEPYHKKIMRISETPLVGKWTRVYRPGAD